MPMEKRGHPGRPLLPPEQRKAVLNVTISRRHRETLEQVAQTRGETLSGLMRELLDEWLERQCPAAPA
jgi:hypothetical protein